MRAALVVVAASLLFVSCATTPVPTSAAVLSVENRGGPDLLVKVNDVSVATVPCGGGASIIAGASSVPQLPWDVSVVQANDSVVLWKGPVTTLPGWYVQIGDEATGVSKSAIGGPPGPPCPSAGPPSTHAATPSAESTAPAPSPTGDLRIENRGGPALTVEIGGVPILDVACGDYLTIAPGERGAPDLPWDLAFVRARDGAIMWTGPVASLPGWYVQMGEHGLGVSPGAVLGPAGPPCPSPAPGSDIAPPPPSDVQAALDPLHVTFTPLTEAQLSLVAVTASEAAQTALMLPDYESNGVKWTKVGCEFLGLYTDMPLHLETPYPRPAYLVQTLGDRPSHPAQNVAVNFIDAITGERITGYGSTRPGGLLGTPCGVNA